MKPLRWIWYRWFYRRFMKLAHHHHWHHMKPCYPEGDTMLHCAWCGLRVVIQFREHTILASELFVKKIQNQ